MSGGVGTNSGPAAGPRPASRLVGLAPYRAQAGRGGAGLIIDLNEGAEPGAAVRAALASISADALRRYPIPAELEARIAAEHGIAADRVVVTNGGDDAIDRVCRSVVEPGRVAVGHAPSFEMIPRGVRLAGGEWREIEWLGGGFPLEAMLGVIDESVSLVSLVSPNNPTGGVVPIDVMRAVVRAAGDVGALVMLDLAYVEFADEDPTLAVIDEPNVVMVRTFSKAFGLAGLRVGYAIAPEPVSGWLRTVGGPFPVSVPALAATGHALETVASRVPFIDRVRWQRDALAAELGALGFEALDSQGNFVLVRVPDAEALHRGLLERGVLVRRFSGGGALASMLRITVPGDESEYDELVRALRGVAGDASEGDGDG